MPRTSALRPTSSPRAAARARAGREAARVAAERPPGGATTAAAPPSARARPQRLTFSPPPRAPRQLAALWKSEDVQGKWDATNWAKKIQKRKLRASMTDFDRFQVMLARKERSAARKAA